MSTQVSLWLAGRLGKEAWRLKDNITLIGMPGCGKSTLGVVLAKTMGYGFIDSDLLIQGREGRLLSEIIEADGLGRFKEIEEDVNASIETSHSVIATGGSVVYGEKAMEHLREISLVVYLYLPVEEIEARVGDLSSRGVAIAEGETLADLFREREPLYEKYAHTRIDVDGMDIRTAVKGISDIFNNI